VRKKPQYREGPGPLGAVEPQKYITDDCIVLCFMFMISICLMFYVCDHYMFYFLFMIIVCFMFYVYDH
jgi:hypothetical protein